MNILLATHHFPPKYWGGGELRTYETARWLQQRGHRVRVVCVESPNAPDTHSLRFVDDAFEGIPVRRLFFNLASAPDPFRYTYDNPWIGEHLQTWLAQDPPDVFHVIGGYLISASALDAARAAGIPTFVTLLEFWFQCAVNILLRGDNTLCDGPSDLVDCARCVMDQQRRYRFFDERVPRASRAFWHFAANHSWLADSTGLTARLAQLGARRAKLFDALIQTDAIISPSQFIMDMAAANHVPREKLHLIGHLEAKPPLTARWRKTASDHLRIGYLGQMTKMKGVDVLIDAFQRIKPRAQPPQLVLYGNVNAFPRFGQTLQTKARGNPNILFKGTYDREQVYTVLQEIDVLAFPSIWYENAPRVLREAFETGTPVIAGNLGSAAEYVTQDVNGLLFERGDVNDLTRQIQSLVDEPARVETLRRGIPRVKPLDDEMSELLALYAQTLEMRGARG
ncbi:MAG: glycosyl transferase family 1 [Chloroflexota bacterium]|nr:MAG: glycosyl transferase family 1 [Chloroflexota bacterium]